MKAPRREVYEACEEGSREDRRLREQRDAIIIRWDPSTSEPVVGDAALTKPLTTEEKVDALYQLSRRPKFFSSFAWAIFGIIGGIVGSWFVAHFLPH